jgi:ribosomal protein L16 Arg81 hydroxylase
LSRFESGAAIGRCTGLDQAAFAGEYWSQKPLESHHSEGFGDLLSAADIDSLVAERGIRTPFFRMVQAGDSSAAATRTAKAGNRRISDLVDADAVREQYADGATLVLQSMHRIHPPLVRFCRELAAELGHPTQCNAYVTPPGSQGFAPHHDTHDVFVLQVDGHKRWLVHPPALELPLSSQPSQGLTSDAPLVPAGTPPMLSVVLGPGDALYLPRGFIHAAETGEDRSIHLTVGVLAATAYDVVRDVLTLAADEPGFRRALPLGPPHEQLAAVAGIVKEAASWLAELPSERLEDAVRARVTGVEGPEPLGPLGAEEALRLLDKATLVRPRGGLVTQLDHADDGDRVLLRLPDRGISLPGYLAPALRALLSGPCRVGELDLPVDDGLVLVRRLMAEGVVTAA